MFSMRYYSPAVHLQPFLSSYYIFDFPGTVHDVMRAELPNVRFLLNGKATLSWADGAPRPGPDASIFGARCQPLGLVCKGPGKIFGAGIMPLGWAKFFGFDAHELADQMVPLEDIAGPVATMTLDRMREHPSDIELVAAADAFFNELAGRYRLDNDWFGPMVEDWLVDGGSNIDALIDQVDLSARQVERLCRRYYGAPPKLLLRKYRALRSAVRFSIDPETSWMDAAGNDYYDQSHFIREFKSFIGMTPRQFALQGAAVMNHSIRLRRTLPTLPRLSLVS